MDAAPGNQLQEGEKPNGVLLVGLLLTRLTAALGLIALLGFVVIQPHNPTADALEHPAAHVHPIESAPASASAQVAATPVEAPTTSVFDEALKLRGSWARNAEECARIPLVLEVTRDERGERMIWNANNVTAEQIFRLDDTDGVVTRMDGWEYRYLRVGDRLQVKDPTDPELTILIKCS